MPGGQPAGDEQAEPVGVGQVEVGRLGQLGVELAASCSAGMPRPRSSTSMAKPLATRSARTSTRVVDGENSVAFSISSASRWIMSVTADAATASSASEMTVTRV